MRRSWQASVVVAMAMAMAMAMAIGGGCANTKFKSTWTDPTATPGELEGKRVAAFTVVSKESRRRAAEDALAAELARHGVLGVPGHQLIHGVPSAGNDLWAQLSEQNVQGAVIMRVLGRREDSRYLPAYLPGGPSFIPARVGSGSDPTAMFGPGYVATSTTVSVETVVYSVHDGKVIWRGVSETFNPLRVDTVIKNSVYEAAREMKKAGLIGP